MPLMQLTQTDNTSKNKSRGCTQGKENYSLNESAAMIYAETGTMPGFLSRESEIFSDLHVTHVIIC